MVEVNKQDVVHINVPFLLRLLEWAREEALADIDLHYVAERLTTLSETGETLTTDKYFEVVPHTKNLVLE